MSNTFKRYSLFHDMDTTSCVIYIAVSLKFKRFVATINLRDVPNYWQITILCVPHRRARNDIYYSIIKISEEK